MAITRNNDALKFVNGAGNTEEGNIVGSVPVDPKTGKTVRPSGSQWTPKGCVLVTVPNTVKTLAELLTAASATLPADTVTIYLQPRADGIRYAHGGATPGITSSDPGVDIFNGGQYPLDMDDNFASLKFISTGSVKLNIEFRG